MRHSSPSGATLTIDVAGPVESDALGVLTRRLVERDEHIDRRLRVGETGGDQGEQDGDGCDEGRGTSKVPWASHGGPPLAPGGGAARGSTLPMKLGLGNRSCWTEAATWSKSPRSSGSRTTDANFPSSSKRMSIPRLTCTWWLGPPPTCGDERSCGRPRARRWWALGRAENVSQADHAPRERLVAAMGSGERGGSWELDHDVRSDRSLEGIEVTMHERGHQPGEQGLTLQLDLPTGVMSISPLSAATWAAQPV